MCFQFSVGCQRWWVRGRLPALVFVVHYSAALWGCWVVMVLQCWASEDKVPSSVTCEEIWWSLLRPRPGYPEFCDIAHLCVGIPITLRLVRLYGLCTR